jgi:hypothetical protein
MIDRDTAVRLVRDVTYKPGWEFLLAEDLDLFTRVIHGVDLVADGHIKVLVTFPGPDSSIEFAPNYEREVPLMFFAELNLDAMSTPQDFHDAFFAEIVRKEVHEAQEFYRLRSKQFQAPYHPHIPAGEKAFGRVRPRLNNRFASA